MASGDVAEWLGGGLQNLIQRFKSARRLQMNNFYCTNIDRIYSADLIIQIILWKDKKQSNSFI